MNKKIIISLIIVIVVITSIIIGVEMSEDEDIKVVNNETDAEYEIIFESQWSESTHPYDFPSNPHFSGLIGATHNSKVIFWDIGKLASTGIKNMAETGQKDPLNNEIDDAIKDGFAFNKISGNGIGKSPGSISLTFQISKDYPKVTLVSMIAPSPDWFVGVTNLSLYENGVWESEKVVQLYLYDAGTDSGENFTSANFETSPPMPISHINETVLPESNVQYGTFRFIKK